MLQNGQGAKRPKKPTSGIRKRQKGFERRPLFLPWPCTLLFCSVLAGCAGAPPKPTQDFQNFAEYDRSVSAAFQKVAPRRTETSRKNTLNAISSIKKDHEKQKERCEKMALPALASKTKTELAALYPTGETSIFSLKFSGVAAGEMVLETRPTDQINHHPVCHFMAKLHTNKVFSLFFGLEDQIDLHYDPENLVPISTSVHAEETKKLQETRTFYDWGQMHAEEWEKTIEKNRPLHERKKEWDLKPSSQNLFSILYYLRTQNLVPGTTVSFPVSHDEKNFLFKGQVLDREQVHTLAGDMWTVRIKTSDDFTRIFNKTQGETFLWMSDDDKKILVQIETPLRYGKLTGQLKSFKLYNHL